MSLKPPSICKMVRSRKHLVLPSWMPQKKFNDTKCGFCWYSDLISHKHTDTHTPTHARTHTERERERERGRGRGRGRARARGRARERHRRRDRERDRQTDRQTERPTWVNYATVQNEKITVHPWSTCPQNIGVLYTMSLQFAWIPFWWLLSKQRAYAFFHPTVSKKPLRKLFRFVSYLRKNLLLTFLFSNSHIRADNPGRQSVKRNVWGWTYFWALVGTIFFIMTQAKTKLKKVLSQAFF